MKLLDKIKQDPFASLTYQKYHSVKTIIDAGFFNDGQDSSYSSSPICDPHWLTTPYQKIVDHLKNTKSKKSRAILVSTGAFSPVHQGHLAMMESAKQVVEKHGWDVVGGYLSPSHDTYVSSKYKDTKSIPISERLIQCQQMVASSDWLMIDPWEGQYNRVPITYTSVILRLELYLQINLRPNLPFTIFYVFGGDNAAFARLFIGQGNCVCVTRPGYESKVTEI